MTLEQRKARLAGMTEAIRERNAPSYPWRETDLMPTAAKRWRKKTTIEAVQWFANGHCPVWAQAAVEEAGDRFTIRTREGVLTGIPGDWIARGIEGEVYPIGPDIFAKTYEPADLSSDARPAPMAEEVRKALAEALHVLDMAVICMRGRDQTEHEANVIVAGKLVLAKHTDLGNWTYGKEIDAPSRTEMQLRLNAVLGRPSSGPATETERKDGFWVTPEWRETWGYSRLFISGLAAGWIVHRDDPERFEVRLDGNVILPPDLATLDEAKAVLLASVRPKQEGV